jgi:hypothetical protein
MGRMIYKADHGRPNYSQRNNEVKPFESCNVTSMVMALSYLGYEFPKGKYRQPEDNLRFHIENDMYCKRYYQEYCVKNPWAKGIPAVQIHDVLNWGTNNWMGAQVTHFQWAVRIDEMINEIKCGRPVVISGTFPREGKEPLGHIVVLVGFNDETREVCYDDPYGKTYEWAPDVSGNDTWVSWELFIRDIKEPGNALVKWGHLFRERNIGGGYE